MGASAGGGDAVVAGVKDKATEGVDGRFAKDDGWWRLSRRQGWRGHGRGEEADVFLGTRGHAPPGERPGAAQFGADRIVFLSKEQEDGVGVWIGVKAAGLDEGMDQFGGKAALEDQVISDTLQMARLGRRQSKDWFLRRRRVRLAERTRKMPVEPLP